MANKGMTTPSLEELPLRDLDVQDARVAWCTRGESSWAEFESGLRQLQSAGALDGHESAAEELEVLAKHAARIALHREIWDRVDGSELAGMHLKA